MAILGTRITRTEAVRKKNAMAEGMNVNINIKEVKNEKEHLLVSFEYAIHYLPDVAEMKIEGEIYASPDKSVEEAYKKTKVLPNEFAEEVLTALTYTASTAGTLLAYGIGVNAPINVPRVRLGGPQSAPTKKAG